MWYQITYLGCFMDYTITIKLIADFLKYQFASHLFLLLFLD